MSGSNPYAVNGYSSTGGTNSNAANRYANPYAQNNNPSSTSVNSYASRERRAGTYGAVNDAASSHSHEQSPQPPPSQTRYGNNEETDLRRRQATRDADYGDSSRSRSRPRRLNGINGSRQGRTIEEAVQHIQSNWKFMGGDDCVPVQVALKLMDPSTLGLADREPEFQQTHVDLQRALKSVVNEHHQDFNSSIGTYHKIQSSIQASQSRVRYLKNALITAQGSMLTTKPELKGLAMSSQEYDDTLQRFGQIENAQGVPERLEAQISEKRFLSAVDVLQETLRLVRRSDFDDIGAIADLRIYFANQEQSLTDILIEELHDHLYLKSPYCQDRWKGRALSEEKDAQASMSLSGINSWDKPVYHYLSALDTKTAMTDDASRNPEADTFYYMHMVLESLNRLGHLEEAINRIEQRMPVELHKVADKTNYEIDARYPGHLRAQANDKRIEFQTGPINDGKAVVLTDYLWTLYAKFEAIAEGHRVLHEVVSGIVEREHLQKPEKYTGGFKELWKLYQAEIRSILHDYLAADGDVTLRTGSSAGAGDVFSRNQRDKNKRMFKLSEMDQKSVILKNEQEELDNILKMSVPGLVSKSRGKSGRVGNSDRKGHDSSSAGHKLLVQPSVFNMTILLPPSLSFLQQLKDIVPVRSGVAVSTLTSFLDDFLINVFHPQLEEAVTELCTRAVLDLEAFTEDSQWSKHSPRPIFKGTVAFISLIRAFSSMLSSIPRDQMFTQLIISQLVSYYDKCYGWFKTIVSRLGPSAANPNINTLAMRPAAAYAESGELHDVAAELFKPGLDRSKMHELMDEEIKLLLRATKLSPMTPADIISNPKNVQAISLLYNSMQWISSSLSQLRLVEESTNSPHARRASLSQIQTQTRARRWTLLASLKPQHGRTKSGSSVAGPVHLPLTPESVILFDTTVTSFRNLAQLTLMTLHLDIRCGMIHQLTRSLRGTTTTNDALPANIVSDSQSPYSQTPAPSTRDSSAPPGAHNSPWMLPSPPSSASPLILSLNTDLIDFDTNTSMYLSAKDRAFITRGLASLVDQTLVLRADEISAMNDNGASRMRLDLLVLQQNLRNISTASGSGGANPSRTMRDRSATASSSASSHGTTKSKAAAAADEHESEADTTLTRASKYFSLFLEGPDTILAYAQQQKKYQARNTTTSNQTTASTGTSSTTTAAPAAVLVGARVEFSYDALRTLLELSYSAALRSEDREEQLKAKKGCQDKLLKLGEEMWDS